MVYRVSLALLFVLALVLTLNERWQERRAYQNAEAGGISAVGGSSPMAREIARAPSTPASAAPVTSSRPSGPFRPHRVRTKRDVQLLTAPEPMAQPVEPISHVPAGIPAQATDERNGWYLLDTNLVKGWAPIDAVEEP